MQHREQDWTRTTQRQARPASSTNANASIGTSSIPSSPATSRRLPSRSSDMDILRSASTGSGANSEGTTSFDPQTAASAAPTTATALKGPYRSHEHPQVLRRSGSFPSPDIGGSRTLGRGSASKALLGSYKARQWSARKLLMQKTALYGVVTVLRLCYMLLAMSFHVGILAVIVGSLTGTQLCLDFNALEGTGRGSASSGYEHLRSSLDDARDYGESHEDPLASTPRPSLFDLDDEGADAQQDDGTETLPLRSHVALSRAHDCV
ncbi:unnamed protein product [Mortierella alpina]